jgi:type V secretory pathway adhesin AidA
MSKLDAQRAMREANWAARQKATPAPAPAKSPAAAPRTPEPAGTPEPAATPEPSATGLCGHRAIGGNTCTRPAGHAEKNHRYK